MDSNENSNILYTLLVEFLYTRLRKSLAIPYSESFYIVQLLGGGEGVV